MAVGTALAIGAGISAASAAGQAVAAGSASGAQQKMALAQAQEAERNRQQALSFAAPTQNELALIQRQVESEQVAVENQKRLLARQESLLDATDPALKEAGIQALALLKGQDSQALDPLKRQRAQQRASLVSSLQEQLGPGFETTSAGAKALRNFDLQTSDALAAGQQATLGNLLGVTQNTRNMATSSALSAGEQVRGFQGQTAMTLGNIQSRQAHAALGSKTADYAGASHVGEYQNAHSLGSMFGGLGQLGGQLMGAGLGGQPGGTTNNYYGDQGGNNNESLYQNQYASLR